MVDENEISLLVLREVVKRWKIPEKKACFSNSFFEELPMKLYQKQQQLYKCSNFFSLLAIASSLSVESSTATLYEFEVGEKYIYIATFLEISNSKLLKQILKLTMLPKFPIDEKN